jgi:uncharacterized protein YndB with AHSA1/START domain
MRDFSIQVDIAAPPARVWEVMADAERWAEWTPSVTSVEIHDKPMRLGSSATIRQPKVPPGRFKVTWFEPGKGFTWSTGIPGILFARAHHVIEPSPLGARVTLAVRFDGLFGGVMGKRMATLNREYIAMEAAGLKRFAEEGPRDAGTSLEAWSAEAVRRLHEQRAGSAASAPASPEGRP